MPVMEVATPVEAPVVMPTDVGTPYSNKRDFSGATLKEKVEFIKQELGIDPNENLGKAIKLANEKMGIEGKGPLPQQADALCGQLDASPEA